MTIHIEDLRFQCIIGILDFERLNPQDVIINLTIEYEYQGTFINYADVVELIKKRMIEKKYLLIEDALIDLAALLQTDFPLLENAELKITKPSILRDASVSVSTKFKTDS